MRSFHRVCSSLALAGLALALALATPARAADPVSFPATSWSGLAIASVKVPGGGKVAVPVLAEVHFGPLGSPSLGATDFLIVLDDGFETFEVEGTYIIDAKGRPVLTADLGALETQMMSLLVHVCEDVLGLTVECDILDGADLAFDGTKVKLKVKGKAKLGVELVQAGAKIPFLLLAQGEAFKIALSFKSGPLAP